MADGYVMQLATMMVLTAAKLAAPILLTALLVGFAVSLIISGNWMIQTLVNFTFDSFQLLPSMLGSG